MSTRRLKICVRCLRAVPVVGHRCRGYSLEREKRRLAAKRKSKGWATAAWAKTRAKAIRRDRACRACGRMDDLTAHLLLGENHATARVADVITLCRRCHGKLDGGRQR